MTYEDSITGHTIYTDDNGQEYSYTDDGELIWWEKTETTEEDTE